MGRPKEYERWQLLHWLKDFAEELGHTPTLDEIGNEPSMPSRTVYQGASGSNYFDTYAQACRLAGLKSNKKYSINKRSIIHSLNKYRYENGCYPKKLEDFENTEYLFSRTSYYRKYKTYTEAKEVAKKFYNGFYEPVPIK